MKQKRFKWWQLLLVAVILVMVGNLAYGALKKVHLPLKIRNIQRSRSAKQRH